MIDMALTIAANNTDYPKWPLGAVIVKGGAVMGIGWYKLRNRPTVVAGCSEHAEQAALRRARKSDLNGATIFVARVGKGGEPRVARPCSECENALRAAGIKKVVYTHEDGKEVIWKF
jgi:pyrimidine deaminase RibD-like protein